ncbi:MAG: sugar phosphate nucleotidyltransferase [Pseudomonadota bacterium]
MECRDLPHVGGKPLIYYPLTAMIQTGLEDVAVVAPAPLQPALNRLLGEGSGFGLSVTYIAQAADGDMAEAPSLARDFLRGMPSLLMPAHGIVSAARLGDMLSRASTRLRGAAVLTAQIASGAAGTPVATDALGKVMQLGRGPKGSQRTTEEFTGVALLDARAPDFAEWLPDGRASMTDLLGLYQRSRALTATSIGDGGTWFAVTTPREAEDATRFVAGLERRRRGLFGSPELAAFKAGRIGRRDLADAVETWDDTPYGAALADALERRRRPRGTRDALHVVAG